MTLTRASRYPALQSRAQFMGKVQHSVSTTSSDMNGNSLLKQKFRELDISTSLISSEDEEKIDSKIEVSKGRNRSVHWDKSSIGQYVSTPKQSVPDFAVPPVVKSVFEPRFPLNRRVSVEPRQFVLEKIGMMMDDELLSESETGDAISLAMKPDSTFEAMKSLLNSRTTLKAQSVFLKMWLGGRSSPSPIAHTSELFRPKPIYRGISQETTSGESSGEAILRSISFNQQAAMPSMSPPLVPISLQFGDRSTLSTPPLVFAHASQPVHKNEYLV